MRKGHYRTAQALLSLSSLLFFKYPLSSYKKTRKAITSLFFRVFFSVLESPCNAAAKQGCPDHKDRAASVVFFTCCLQKKRDRDFLHAKAFRSGHWKFKQTPQSSNSCCHPVISTRNQSLVQFQALPRSRTKNQKGEGGAAGSEPKSHIPWEKGLHFIAQNKIKNRLKVHGSRKIQVEDFFCRDLQQWTAQEI